LAILIRGKTVCQLCGQVISTGDDVAAFAAFISNKLDPLLVFDDGAFHEACFSRHPLAPEARRRFEEYLGQTRSRKCAVCGGDFVDPADFVQVGHLSDNPSDPLRAFNYLCFHRSHLGDWPGRQLLYRELSARVRSGKLRSPGYDVLLAALSEAGMS
jgi:hypothetical protein